MMKKILFILFALTLGLMPMSLVQAADVRTDQDSISIGEKEVVKDLYLTSDSVIVNSPVSGDLATFGSNIIVNGNTEDSLFAAGKTIVIRGSVTRHLRSVGSNITISGNVGGDVFIAGSTVNITSDTTIGGDLYIAGQNVTVSGVVKGVTKIAASDVAINGRLADNVIRSQNLNINDGAVLEKGLNYYSPDTANIHSNAKVTGEVNYHKIESQSTRELKGLFGIFSLMMFIGSFLLILLLIKLFKPTIENLIEQNTTKFWANLGVGFLTLFVAPMALIALLFTVVGIPFAGLVAIVWVVCLCFAGILTQLYVGSWLYKTVKHQNYYRLDYVTVIIGVLATGIVKVIPVIGPVVVFIVFLVSLGNITANLRGLKTNKQA